MEYQRDTVDRVRLALVGVGMHAYRNLLPLLTFLPVELVAVADVDLDLAERTARQYGVRAYGSAAQMYASEALDAVLLCVSPNAHPQLTIEAFQAGLHVWMEKPAAVSVSEVDRMLTEQGDRVAVVGYKKAFMPATAKVLELTENDEPSTISATYPMAVPTADDPDGPGQQHAAALWLANGCHPLSFLVRVAGPGASVTVHRGRESSGVLVLRHRSGTLSNLHLAMGAPYSQPFERYTVHGRATTLTVENSRRVTYQRGTPMDSHTHTFAPTGLGNGAVVWEAQDSMSTFEGRAEVTQGLYGGLAHAAAIVSAGDTIEIGDES
jgi:predicted dehydrogenase